MKKQIRLLVEGLFDDLYDIEDNKNLDTEIADKFITYKVGDIFYKNKKPYAICCGDKENFIDNNQRFYLFNQYKFNPIVQDNTKQFFINGKSKKIDDNLKIENKDKNNLKHIDENGYENTQSLLKIKCNKNESCAINYFKILNKHYNNVYFPAIDEIQIFLFNLDIINSIIKKLIGTQFSEKDTDKLWDCYWSSTQTKLYEKFLFTHFKSDLKTLIVHSSNIIQFNYIIPFIKI